MGVISIGDRVRKKSGIAFNGGRMEVTVDRFEDYGNRVYFKETGTWLGESELMVVETVEFDDNAVI